ncbi:MAG: hypothetical protein AAFR93_06545 [Pseudomonadota bacterium]
MSVRVLSVALTVLILGLTYWVVTDRIMPDPVSAQSSLGTAPASAPQGDAPTDPAPPTSLSLCEIAGGTEERQPFEMNNRNTFLSEEQGFAFIYESGRKTIRAASEYWRDTCALPSSLRLVMTTLSGLTLEIVLLLVSSIVIFLARSAHIQAEERNSKH